MVNDKGSLGDFNKKSETPQKFWLELLRTYYNPMPQNRHSQKLGKESPHPISPDRKDDPDIESLALAILRCSFCTT